MKYLKPTIYALTFLLALTLASSASAAITIRPALVFSTGGSIIISSSKNINTDTLTSGRSCADGGDGVVYSVTALSANTATLSASPAAGCLSANDRIILINLQADDTNLTNVGNYEFLVVSSVVANTVTFTANKTKYYGNGASDDTNIGTTTTEQRVILQRVPQYMDVTILSGGALTASGWDGVKGGVLAFYASGQVDVQSGGSIDMSGKGYRSTATNSSQGESYNSAGAIMQTANLGGGGGDDNFDDYDCGYDIYGAGGGGYGTAGSDGWYGYADGGAAYGNANLDKLFPGSGGGSTEHTGGSGGGIIYVKASSVSLTGSVLNNGETTTAIGFGGGAGAGGSIYLSGNILDLGVNKLTASGGVGDIDVDVNCEIQSGNGGAGRIHLKSSNIYGTTNPVAATSSLGIARFSQPNNNGLVGYWSFEEGMGAKAGDFSGKGKTGTITGASWTNGKRGQALSFDGTSNYIDLGNVNNGVKTISFWVKASTTTNRIIDFNGTAKMELSSGAITTSGITSPTIYVDGAESSNVDTNWHLVTIKTDTGINASAAKLGQGDTWACGDALVDLRDSKSYATVQIDSQCWMKQNMNIGTRINADSNQGTNCSSAAVINKYCYSNADANCDSSNNPNYPDGGLYQWNQMMCGAATCNGTGESQPSCSSPAQGICPLGWHVPSHYEFNALERAVCSSGSCTTDLPYDTSTTGWRGTDEGAKIRYNGSAGFEGNLGGQRWTSAFYFRNTLGFWWSSTQGSSIDAWRRDISDSSYVDRGVYDKGQYGLSVRCVKDIAPIPYFQGKLDEVRMYNRALSASEVASLYQSSGRKTTINSSQNTQLTSGLVGLWSFNGPDISGTTAYDRSGFGNNGTITGATKVIGKVGQGMKFDGASNHIDANDINTTDGIPQLTVTAWIKQDALISDFKDIAAKYSSAVEGWRMCTFNNQIRMAFSFDDYGQVSIHQSEQWEHIVSVFDGTQTGNAERLKIYLNGSLQTLGFIGAIPSTTPSNDNLFCIGGDSGGASGSACAARNWNGKIDEVRIYNRALSAAEVSRLYNMGR